MDAVPTSQNIDVALALAAQGAFVFPCQSSGATKKQPYRGVFWRSVSTRDENKVRDFWRRFPEAVPAIDLAKTGLLVIDCDKKPADGVQWLAENAPEPLTAPIVRTPSGGQHFYFRNLSPPHGNGRGCLPPKKECGIDVRGSGGFVIAPGAVFSDGSGTYSEADIFNASLPRIWKDPVVEMQRTKALGLLYKQMQKDATRSRQGMPDYVLVFRKTPGDEKSGEPVAQDANHFPVEQWQQWASPVWMDINQTNVLNCAAAREQADEKHICPLQLDLIERAIRLWSNLNDIVLSPFMGIGSEGVMALRAGRRFIGTELKASYYKQACRFLDQAAAESALFDH